MTLSGSTPTRTKAMKASSNRAKAMTKAKAMARATNKVMKDCRNYNNSIYLTLKHFLE
jgi:hypothetical protein